MTERTRLISLFIMDLSLRSIKTNKWPADNFKGQVTSTSCTLEPAIQSGETGQRIPFYSWPFTITGILNMYALDTYVASNAQPLQENSQSGRAYYCIHVTKHRNNKVQCCLLFKRLRSFVSHKLSQSFLRRLND